MRATPTIRARSTRRAACPAARDYSRAYLHHLVKANEMLGAMLLSAINLAYYQALMAGMRAAIAPADLPTFRDMTMDRWERGDMPALYVTAVDSHVCRLDKATA